MLGDGLAQIRQDGQRLFNFAKAEIVKHNVKRSLGRVCVCVCVFGEQDKTMQQRKTVVTASRGKRRKEEKLTRLIDRIELVNGYAGVFEARVAANACNSATLPELIASCSTLIGG